MSKRKTWGRHGLAGALLALGGGLAYGHDDAKGDAPEVWIDVVRDAAAVRLVPSARADVEMSGRYELAVTRVGAAGRSTSRQSGKAALGPDVDKTGLSVVKMSIGEGDRLEAVLTLVLEDGSEVVRTVTVN